MSVAGTRELNRLEVNLGAAEVELSGDELTEIDQATRRSRCGVAGTTRPANA